MFRRISVPDFFDFLRSIFPYLYAVDNDNATIIDLHDNELAYHVMHEHIVHFHFFNLVAGFNSALITTIKDLENSARTANEKLEFAQFTTLEVMNPTGFLQVLTMPTTVKCSEHFSVNVEVNNQSDCTWFGYGNRPVFLSYHWLDEEGHYIIFDGVRSQLNKDKSELLPGQILCTTINIAAPQLSGRYKLIATLVQEHICWFEQKGFKPAEINIKVV